MMNNWTLGIDTSHWSGNINFDTMYKAGARFWITKATDANKSTGSQFEDSRFDGYMKAAIAQGKLLIGCYHWLQANVDPTVAADFYLERYKRYKMDFPPILDFEEPSVRDTGRYSDYAWRAQMWVKRCEEVTGRKPLIYTAKWYTSYFTTAHLSWMGDYPLWVADYSWYANSVKKAPYFFPSNIWDDYKIWQFSATGFGPEYGIQSASVDRNYFQGDYSQLLDWLQAEQPVPPQTVEERLDDLERRVTLLEGQNAL